MRKQETPQKISFWGAFRFFGSVSMFRRFQLHSTNELSGFVACFALKGLGKGEEGGFVTLFVYFLVSEKKIFNLK